MKSERRKKQSDVAEKPRTRRIRGTNKERETDRQTDREKDRVRAKTRNWRNCDGETDGMN